jgi:hypothetical protein
MVGDATTATIGGLSAGAKYFFAATTISAAGVESAFSNEAAYVIPADPNLPSPPSPEPNTNQPPTLDAIADVTVSENAGEQSLNLTGISAGVDNPNSNVIVSASSSDITIIPTPTVNYTSPDNTGTLTFAPAANATGTATVTVTVNNGGASNNVESETFTITVTPPPAPVIIPPPTLNLISNVTIYENAGEQTIPLTGISAGTAAGNLIVNLWAYTSDGTIIPAPTVNYASPNTTGTLTFTPMPNAVGTAIVTVKVNNGAANLIQVFTVSVLPTPAVAPTPVVPQPPTLDAITNVTLSENGGPESVILTGIGAGSGGDDSNLMISATSANPAVIPPPVVSYAAPSQTGSLVFSPAVNAIGTSAITVTVSNIAESTVTEQTFTISVTKPVASGINASVPPTMGAIANISIPQGTTTENVTLTGISSGSAASQSLRITATSSNPRLLPPPVIHYLASGSTATLTLKPSPVGTGTAMVTVTVAVGAQVVRQTFTVTVTTDKPPTLAPIGSATLVEGAGAQTITLTGITPGVGVGIRALSITAVSSDPRLVLNPSVQYANPANTALLTLTPAGKLTGSAMVTVTVNNGNRSNGSARQRFMVTVTPPVSNPAPSVAALAVSHSVSKPANTDARLEAAVRENGQFHFQVNGIAGGQYVVEATSDLIQWTPVETNAAPFTFQAAAVEGVSQQFYRAIYVK